ncbi:putative phage tail protein [Nocardia nova SH22a]|uniref:Putative phage tail protein n=1 Tax=Nocardia nova SH22a TaxID=1415166 RepID=W5TC90_9NOCA|nr:hypothetical protein [Nocardia nova]AHH16593.1 putative phage tail protein [Nocardia nova SH22a]
MSDIAFSAHLTVTEDIDPDGNLPILTAAVQLDDDAAALPLPGGPQGDFGDRGAPQAPFVKMGTVANEAARPTGLGAGDRGKWWHRLDDDGMDVWTGTAWTHSAAAVGPQGDPAPATTLDVTTVHDAALTIPAIKITGPGPALTAIVTAPAGLPGPAGPAGDSGAIATATDYDGSTAPLQGGVMAYNLGSKKWRALPPPGGYGPWSWYGTDFAADQETATDKLIAGTFGLPALPFQYRPLVFAQLATYCQTGQNSDVLACVRLNNSNGVLLAQAAGIRADGNYNLYGLNPTYGDDATKPLSPSSAYATVPAYQPASLVVTAERVGSTTSNATIGYKQATASLVVWAMPV